MATTVNRSNLLVTTAASFASRLDLRDIFPKEQLWDHLDSFVDNAIDFLQAEIQLPDLLHSHYADGGYVGSRIAHVLGNSADSYRAFAGPGQTPPAAGFRSQCR